MTLSLLKFWSSGWGTPRTMVAGIALAAGGLLLIIGTQWDSFGESSQRWRMTGRIRHLGRMPGGWPPASGQVRERPLNGTVLVRAPSSRLAEGIVTHIRRTPVDVPRARAQHAAYADALAACGWMIAQAPAAEDCPDSVFIEDTVVVCEDLAVLTRPGAPARRAEVAGIAGIAGSMGLRTAAIQEPGTLDGGDVLQSGRTVYVGRGGRTNGAGIRQLRALLAPLGRTVVGVPLSGVLHLKSAVTALPDGTFLLLPQLVPAGLFPAVRPVDEESGCHVVPLGGDQVLIAASAPRTAELLDDMGFTPVVVDISEFEKLEGCVTCLSVLLPGQ